MIKWKLVPVEPTPEMDNAARDWSVSKYGRGIGNDAAHGCYSAMLEAAPQPPRLSDERILEICGFRPESKAEIGADIVRNRWLEIARYIEREILGGEA